LKKFPGGGGVITVEDGLFFVYNINVDVRSVLREKNVKDYFSIH